MMSRRSKRSGFRGGTAKAVLRSHTLRKSSPLQIPLLRDAGGAPLRIFVAVALPEKLREKIVAEIQQPLKRVLADVRWAEPEKFHLTLKFLGEVPEEKLEPLQQAVGKAAAGTGSFEVSLKGLGAFPSVRRPRVVWLGIQEGKDALVALAGRIDEALAELGFEKEQRPFTGHLTLGRVRSPQNLEALVKKIEILKDSDAGSFTAGSVDIMQSILHPRGSRYTCLRSISI